LASPWAVQAQDTTLGGTIKDSTGGVLPGATVTAIHVETGNTFVGVAGAAGDYRISALRPGMYRVTTELSGFATITRQDLELLLGQRVLLDFEMKPSTLEESVTVTAAGPLVDLSRTRMGGNIDPRQMQQLPVLGRNWMDLSMLAPGSKANHVDESPAQAGADSKSFQLNMDGQQVTNMVSSAGFGQPRFSRDMIAEFELVTNRFDATQGRSMQALVNAITKSGTNTFAGTFSGYFRDDKLNAKDFFADRVLPYSSQLVGGTFGGPIKHDRVHFFVNYEFEREPLTFVFTSPYSAFNISDFDKSTRLEHKGGLRMDTQFNASQRLMARFHRYALDLPNDPRSTGGASLHPSASNRTTRSSDQYFATLTQVLRPTVVHELKGGFTRFHFFSEGVVPFSPRIQLRGYALGEPTNYMQDIPQDTYQIRSDWTFIRGRHELKTGGEFVYNTTCLCPWLQFADGQINATLGPVPGNIEQIFPVWNDVSTWNLAALSPITSFYQTSVGDYFFEDKKRIGAAYVQDGWRVNNGLTVNLGLRYDVSAGSKAESVVFEPFLPEPRPTEKLNFQPRLGLTYSFADKRTVIRGGLGKYFAELTDAPNYSTNISKQVIGVVVPNDGRPDFAANPFNGPKPTFAQAALLPNRSINVSVVSPDFMSPYSWQSSLGVQRQLAETMSAQADYVYSGTRRELTTRNANISYNPITGVNNPFSNVASRPYAGWGNASLQYSDGRSNSHSLETGLTKRFAKRWQASTTYTLGFLKSADGAPTGPCWTATSGFTDCPSGFVVPPDLGEDYTYAAGDQRHRLVVNGIWQLPYAFQISGLYFYGSGQRVSTSYGADVRQTGPGFTGRLRPDGTIMPRNAIVGDPLHRVDMRLQRTFALGGATRIEGVFEIFNLFNHENYGSYTTIETNPNYGRPAQNTNVVYQPRMMQLGVRVVF
jgi:hypothetical protein